MRLPLLVLLLAASAATPSQGTFANGKGPSPTIDDRIYKAVQAVQAGKVDLVRALLAKGANPNGDSNGGLSLLDNLGGTPDEMLAIAKLLVAKGAKVNPRPSGQGFTPLMNALHRAEEPLGLVRFLLLKGANPNAVMDQGMTALHFAVQWGFVRSAKELLLHGARVDARTKDLVNPQAMEFDRGPSTQRRAEDDQDRMDHIFEPGYREAGETPLFGVAMRWNPAMVDLLLKAGASLKTTDVNGWTVLHHAAKWGNVPAVQGLLARGADPNAASKGGFRPLHLALRAGYGFPSAASVKSLLAKGADPKLANKAGQTPLDLLRADAQWLVSNPSGNPEHAFPPADLTRYQAAVDAVAKALDPHAAPIVLTLPKPDPKGQRYAPLGLIDGEAERTVRVENGEAILELRLPPLAKGSATFTVKEIALEEYDTLTPLPLVVKRVEGVPNTLVFRFPVAAARGGSVNLAADQDGPGNMRGNTGGTDGAHPQPGFRIFGGLAVYHDMPDRTMEFEILSARRSGKEISGVAGKILRMPSGAYVPIPGLTSGDPESPKVTLRFRFRYLPNVKWRKGSMQL